MFHSFYSPDIAPSYFFLFRPIDKHLAVKFFVADDDVKQAIAPCRQTVDFYLIISGDYLEVWCVSSATFVPCTHRSQDEALVVHRKSVARGIIPKVLSSSWENH